MYFVSFAYANGLLPTNIEDRGKQKIFYYNNAQFDELSKKYYARECVIEPIAYQNALRNVKALIYNH